MYEFSVISKKQFPVNSKYLHASFVALILCITMACSSETPHSSNVETYELSHFETFVGIQDTALATPTIMKYDDSSSHLFIYDKAKGRVLELNKSGDIVNEYGRRGRGPGEFIRVNNIFLTSNYLYVVDKVLFRISKYERKDNLVSTTVYETTKGGPPPPPFSTSVIRAPNINNEPAVTLKGNVLLPIAGTSEIPPSLYEIIDWEGNHISNVGDVPEGSAFVINPEKYNNAIENRQIPAFYKPNVFPINDRVNTDEFYLVYSAFPKIAKYHSSGKKLWETKILKNSELDSISNHFYNISEQLSSTSRIALRYYISGASNKKGNLYLGLNSFSNALWIHQFNNTGELIRRYKLISEDQNLLPVFDINFPEQRIYVVTELGEIRTYLF